jgi:hypothetical protein
MQKNLCKSKDIRASRGLPRKFLGWFFEGIEGGKQGVALPALQILVVDDITSRELRP